MSNVFFTDPQRPSSPLLTFYVLWVLRQRMNSIRGDSVEARHWLVAELCEFFESCGVAEELVLKCVRRLYSRRLVEALDPNVRDVGMADKVAIKESGSAHIELVLTSTVYVEQMALTTGINELSTRDEIKRRSVTKNHTSFIELRDLFVRYILKIDAGRLTIPENATYVQIADARRSIRALTTNDRPRQRQGDGRPRPTYPQARRP